MRTPDYTSFTRITRIDTMHHIKYFGSWLSPVKSFLVVVCMPHPKASDLSLAPMLSIQSFKWAASISTKKGFSLQRTHGTLCAS